MKSMKSDRSRMGWLIAGVGMSALTGFAAPAWAQCTGNPAGAVIDADDPVCGAVEANLGCAGDPAVFQALGSFNPGGSETFKISGTVGTYNNGNVRDLDEFSFSVSSAGFVKIAAAIATTSTQVLIQVLVDDCDHILWTSDANASGCVSSPDPGQ